MRHETVEANGLRFHYVTAGDGPLLVLLHGFPQTWYGWRHQIPELAKRFRVVAPDQRGYGDSDKPPRVRDYRIDNLVADVVGIVRALGEERFFLVGHDWGAIVAWTIALEHPEMVERLGILNVPEPRQLARKLLTSPRQLLRSWYVFVFQIPWLPEWLLLARGRKGVEAIFRDGTIRKGVYTDEDLDVFWEAWSKPDAMRSMLNWYRAAFRAGFTDRKRRRDTRKIRVPTLVIWGEEDVALDKTTTYGMEAWVDAPYRIHYVPDTSHWVNEEQPELVNRLLLEHLCGDGGNVR